MANQEQIDPHGSTGSALLQDLGNRLYQQMESFQRRYRQQELRAQSLETSERELIQERAALAEDLQLLHEARERLECLCETCARIALPPNSPVAALYHSTKASENCPGSAETELDHLRRENKRLRLALIELEEMLARLTS